MNFSERLMEMTAGVRDQAGAYAMRAADMARGGADRAATTVDAARNPVETLAAATLKLNVLAHQYIERLVALQAATIQHTLAAGAQRLRKLSEAASVQQALADQADTFARSRTRFSKDAAEAWDIVTGTGRGVSEIAVQTYARLVRAQPVAAKRRPRASAKRPRTTQRTGKRTTKRARNAA